MERAPSDIGEGVGFHSGSCRVYGGKSVTRGEQVQEITKEMSYRCHELKLLTEKDIDVMTQKTIVTIGNLHTIILPLTH